MNWTIKYGEKPMSRKPNRQVKLQFFRSGQGDWDKTTGRYVTTYKWSVRIDIADHGKGYTFLDQNNYSLKFPNLDEAEKYADSVVREVTEFLDKEEN